MVSEVKKMTYDYSKIEVKVEYFICLLPLLFIRGDMNNNIITTFFVCVIFLILIIKKFSFDEDLRLPYFFLWAFIFAWNGYILSISPSFSKGILFYTATVLSPFLVFLIFYNLQIDKKFLITFFNILFFSGIVLSIGSIYYFYNNDFSLTLRISSFWRSQNLLSAFLMVLFFFCFSFLVNKENKKFFLYYVVAIGFISFGIFLTQTRAVWMAILISILFFIVKRPKVFIPATIILGAFVFLFFPVIQDRFLSIQNFTSDTSSIGRLQAWLTSALLIKSNPLFGYGYDSFIELRDSVLPFYLVPVEHSHSTYLNMILEAGLIGFFAYFFFFFKAIYFSFTKKNKNNTIEFKTYWDGLQLTFIGLLIIFFFEPLFTPFDNVCIIVWLVISIAFALNRLAYVKDGISH